MKSNTIDTDEFLSFEKFQLDSVRKTAKPLLASKGNEYDIDFSTMNSKERLAMQKKQIKEQLGFGSEFLEGKLKNDCSFDSGTIE